MEQILKSLELDVLIDKISNNCSFSLGKKHLLNIEPSFNKLIIKQNNIRIKEALSCTYKYGPVQIKGFKDINDALDLCMKDKVLNVNDCLNVISHLNEVKIINTFFKGTNNEFDSLNELVSSLYFNNELYNELSNCFNEYGDIKDDATLTLKEIRESIKKLEFEVTTTIEKYKKENSDILVDGIITSRNDRIVVLAKIKNKNIIGGFVHGESSSGLAAYVEPPIFVKLNNKMISLKMKEEEEIEKILYNCSQNIKKSAIFLKYNLETVAILDSLFARAIWGKENDCVVANLIDDKQLKLINAKHPLIDKDKVVANTYKIISPFKTLLITGSNTGGKTVSLKIIGLMVLMTYSGIPINVKDASIPFFDNVFINIGDKQSVVSSLSTFSSQLFDISNICNKATNNSLVLLDEIGSGTDPKEGESLAIAILDYLRNKNCTIVLTTHYNKLKSYSKKYEDILISSVEFDVEKLVPTYRYIEGISGQSNAFDIAKRYGIKDEIIINAKKIKNESKTNEESLLEKLEKQILENELLKKEYEEKINELNILNNDVKEKLNNINLEKENIINQAIIQANTYYEEKKEEADLIIDKLKNTSNNLKYHEVLKIKNKLKIEEVENTNNEQFNIGDTVLIVSNNKLAKIISINKNQVVLDLKGIVIKSKLSNLKHTNRKINEKPTTVLVNSYKSTESKMECNLIGLTVEEALSVFEKFIDNAKYSKLGIVRVVHGDGTGAIRKAIHSRLKQDKSIKEYKLAMPNEGGTGVTIITL